jgi:hypothetical protein
MIDILDEILKLSYFGIFLLLIGMNAIPILMPPSWIVLSTFYSADSKLNIFILSIIGASGTLLGRIVLLQISTHFRRIISKEKISSLDHLHSVFRRKRYGYFLSSFFYALTPFPSNVMFITFGMMKARSVGILIGFWLGRVVSYYVMISTSSIVLKPFLDLFASRLVGIIITDVASILSVIVFTSINWSRLITEKKLEFIKPKLWKI